MNVTFKQGEYLTYKSLNDFKDLVKKGSVNANTIVFNNLVENKADFISNWETKVSNSWHNNLL